MTLYGAEISEHYLEYKDRKRNHIRYPKSVEYPTEALFYYVPIQYDWKKKKGDWSAASQAPPIP